MKKKHEEHENHERWIVSYADFVTLLFALFVVLYSTASVQEGKYRAMSDSAQKSFNPTAYALKKGDISPKLVSGSRPNGKVEYIVTMKGVLKEFEQNNKLTIFQNSKGIVIRITDTALFDSGSAEIKTQAVGAIDGLAGVLADLKENIQIEGHTDNIPINSPLYPSNWELSSSRATSIVRRFVNYGIEPSRLTAIGYGEYRTIAGNDTGEGRSKNRRVDIVVLNDKPSTGEQQFANPFANLKVE